MPMLADLDDPPRSRLPGFVVGAVIGLPLVALLGWLVLPALMGAILGGAEGFDERLRNEDAYMDAICGEAFDQARDARLCGCVWVAEFPALDCQHRFLRWRLDRAAEACGDQGTRREALSFCSCVEVVTGRVAEAEAAAAPGDPASEVENNGEREAVSAFENCLGLDDALSPPEISTLLPAAADAGG